MSADPLASTPARAGVVVPIRAFTLGKARLAGELDAGARRDLARDLATRVVAAAGALPIAIVSGAPEVRSWAEELAGDADCLDDPGTLDRAAAAGRAWARARGLERVVVAHADLPWATSFRAVLRDAARPIVTIVPCHRDDGTPVMALPTAGDFGFAYGPGSFRRHAAEVRRRGLGLRVVRDPALAFDVDLPADLARVRRPVPVTGP